MVILRELCITKSLSNSHATGKEDSCMRDSRS